MEDDTKSMIAALGFRVPVYTPRRAAPAGRPIAPHPLMGPAGQPYGYVPRPAASVSGVAPRRWAPRFDNFMDKNVPLAGVWPPPCAASAPRTRDVATQVGVTTTTVTTSRR